MFNLIPDYVKEAPLYHLAVEAFLFVWILWLLFRKSYKPVEKNKLTEKVDEFLSNKINEGIFYFIFLNRTKKSC